VQILRVQVSRFLIIGLLLILSANLEGNESEESGDDGHHDQITSAAADIDAEIAPNSPVLGRLDQEEATKGRSMYF
jgi:hypothetical protein